MDDFTFIRRAKELTDRARKSEIAPKTLGASIVGLKPVRTIKTTMTPEELVNAKLERDRADEEQLRQINSPEHRFRCVVGKAYADCRLSNFRFSDDHGQTIHCALNVLNRLKGIAEHIHDAMKSMRQVVLFGKPGVGKDHLIAGLLWEVMRAGYSIHWANGERFAALVRDQLDFDTRLPERVWLKQWVDPAVMALSDPDGEATRVPDPVKQRLYDVVDARIREGRPTWITINGDTEDDIRRRLGARIYDRLRQSAWVLHCDWQSGRKPRGVE